MVLKYGSTSVPCRLPGGQLLQMKQITALQPAHQLVNEALQHPIGTPPLPGMVNAGDKVVIVTSDITRYSASEVYLPLVVDELNRCSIADENISILIALGIHRGQTAEEHRKILGPLYGRIAVYDHDCDDPEQLVDLGITDGGIPVQINRRVMAADRVIVTGTIGFHYFAGFGGGRKGLVPGVASRETCMASHFAVFNPPEIGGKHPSAVTGVLAGNPVHRNLLQAAQRVEPDFLLNTVLGPNKEIVAVFCGELEQAHLAGCELVRSLYSVPVTAAADLAIISCGGEPKDINFIQAQKALDYGCRAVKPGGTIIFLAACRDGFGYPTFFDWFRYQDLDQFEAALRANYQINGQTAHAVLARARRFRILLISEFNSEQTAAMGMEKSADLQTALAQVLPTLPSNFSSVIIPDGGTILPVVTPPTTT
ncbi:nickel-dependent lactate racemase [Pelobacter sp. M08fum]|uniref:Nickel-dependent lactate racemase n=1 Tax=Pelovirga terrestris TaxID=2771352 RepID=A0A8J6R6T7_9BACT|nr:nickel-dependent lactate racemase [Pelovirga terrestris]